MSNLFFKSESVKNSVKSGLNFVSNRVLKVFLLMSMMLLSWNGWAQGYTVIYPDGKTVAEPGDYVTIKFDSDISNYVFGNYKINSESLDESCIFCRPSKNPPIEDKFTAYKDLSNSPYIYDFSETDRTITVFIPSNHSQSVYAFHYASKEKTYIEHIELLGNYVIWLENKLIFTYLEEIVVDVYSENLTIRTDEKCFCPGNSHPFYVENNNYDDLKWSIIYNEVEHDVDIVEKSGDVYYLTIPDNIKGSITVKCVGNVENSAVASCKLNLCKPELMFSSGCVAENSDVDVEFNSCVGINYKLKDSDGKIVFNSESSNNSLSNYKFRFNVGRFESQKNDGKTVFLPKTYEFSIENEVVSYFTITKCDVTLICESYSPGTLVAENCSLSFDVLDDKLSVSQTGGKAITDKEHQYFSVNEGIWESTFNKELQAGNRYKVRTNIYVDGANVGYCESEEFEVRENIKPVITSTAQDNTDLGCNPQKIDAPKFSVSDNCDKSVVVEVQTNGVEGTDSQKSQTWTATAIDVCGNEAAPVSITYIWTVDDEKPVIATNAKDNTDLGCNPTKIDAPEFTVTDNCDKTIQVEVKTDGVEGTDCQKSQTWTATAIDVCGNEAAPVSITYIWTVDDEKPVIATNAKDNTDLGCNPAKIDAPEFTVTDNCDKTIQVEVKTDGVEGTDCQKSQTWTATAIDVCGNEAAPVSITYIWTVDDEKPVIATNAKDNTDLGCNPAKIDAPEFTVTDNCDKTIQVEVKTDGVEGTDCQKSQTWTATAIDVCGNEAAPVSITYIWTVDDEKPVIATNAKDNTDLGCNPAKIDAPEFTVTDNCDKTIQVEVKTDGVEGEDCQKSQTWTATAIDVCGNEAAPVSITYIWTVDDEKPVIATNAKDNTDLGCNPAKIDAPEFTVTDNCDKTIQVEVKTDGVEGTDCQKSQTWTATAIDVCGNEAAPVSITYIWTVDDEKPVIATNAKDNTDLGCNPAKIDAPEFTVTDNCDKTIQVEVKTDGVEGTDCQKSQTWTATAIDVCGNEAAPVSITYIWTVDDEKPVIATNAKNNTDLGCNPAKIDAPEFTVTDNCDKTIQVEVKTDGVEGTDCQKSQTWTATAIDVCGNEAAPVSITYIWTVDDEKPVIATNAKDNTDLGCNPAKIDAPEFTVTDNCDKTIQVEVKTDGVEGTDCQKSQTWTATAIDVCGNEAAPVSITYIWTVDDEKPVIATNAKDNTDLGCNPAKIDAPEFTVTDNCDKTIQVEVKTDGVEGTDCQKSQTWTATAIDVCGNEAAPVSITYIWTVDDEKPVIATEAKSGDKGCNPEIEAPTFTVSDNCDNALEATVTTIGVEGEGCAKSQTWTATAIDVCGNEADPVVITYTWTVDGEKPVIATEAKSGDKGCNPEIEAPTFTVSDNCDNALEATVTTIGVEGEGCAKSQTWTATAIDVCGNEADPVVITYTWTVDGEKPVIATEAKSGDKGCNPEIEAPTFTVSDNCDNALEATVTTIGVEGEGCAKSQTWTATAIDVCGNEADPVVITYTWVDDTEAPIITDLPEEVVANVSACEFSIPNLEEIVRAKASDNCSEDLIITQTPEVGKVITTSTIATIEVKDNCGNSSVVDMLVTVSSPLQLSILSSESYCKGEADGVIEAQIEGGVAPYVLTVNGEIVDVTIGEVGEFVVTGLSDNSYELVVKDANGCISSATTVVKELENVIEVTAKSDSKIYDGEPLVFGADDYVIKGDLLEGDEIVVTVEPASIKNVGSIETSIADVKILRGDLDVTCYYGVEMVHGTLTILKPSKVQVTITEHGAEKTYNNEEYVVTGYDFATSNDLYTLSDFKFHGDSVVSGTNVGSYPMDLKAEDFENLNENFEVEFNVVHNSLVINPLDVLVEITGNRLEVPYDKNEHEVSGYQWSTNSDLYTVEDFEFGGDSALAETNVGVYPMGLESGEFTNLDNNFKVTFNVVKDGSLTILGYDKVQVTITEHGAEKTYNNEEYVVTGYDFASSNDLYTLSDFKFLGDSVVSGTNVGSYLMNLKAEDFENLNENFEVEFNVVHNSLVINPLDVLVEITGNSLEVPYDKKEHEVSGYQWSANSDLYTVEDFEFGGDSALSETNVGVYPMGLESGEFTNLDNNFKVTFNVVKDGSLTILGYDKVQVTITEHGAEKTYNNEEYVVTGYDFASSNDLYTLSDFKFLGDSVVSGTNVGSYPMDLKAEDFENLNKNFEVEFNVVHNSLVINPLDVLVEITGNSLEVPYDKKEHEVSGYQWSANSDLYTVEDFEFGGDSALAETNVGVYPMGLESDEFTNLDNNFKVTFNVVKDGSLTILGYDKVQVTITEHGAVKTYNNEEYVVTGYDFTTSNDLYTLSDFKFLGDSVVSGTNVGSYPMDLKAEDFENLNENFEVEFNVVHNSLVINPLDVLVEITGNRLEVPYDKNEHEVSGYQWSTNSDLYTVEDFEFGGDSALAETNVGVYPMGLESDEFTNLDNNFKVTFNVVKDGSLTILGYDKVQVTITEHGAVKTYNNEEYVVTGYDFTTSNDLYTLSDFKFLGDSVVSGTNVGSYPMGLKTEDFENLNNNFEVEFNIVHNSLVINPLDVLVEITGNRLEVPYDKKEHEVSGYQWSANSDLYTVEDFEFVGDSALAETNVGVYPMGLESGEFTNLDNNFKVTFNVVKDGSLTILGYDKVQVTITEHGAVKTYNNEEYVVTGYDFTTSNDLYTLSDFKFLGDSVVSGTNVGSYPMGLKTEDFENLNNNFEVEFNIVHNSLVINPLDVLVEITGNRLEVPYDKKEHEVSGYQWSANSDLYTVEDFEFVGDSALAETNVGVYPMGLESGEFTNLDNNFKVTFNVVEDGSLTILGYDKVQVTITEHGSVETYNNEEYVVTGYDFATSNDLYTLSDFKFLGDSVVSGTNVGNYAMELTAEDFENLNENFEVEFNVVHNSLVINPLDVLVEITGNSLKVPYDKKEHEVSGYQWSANSDLYTVEDFEFVGDSALAETNVGVYPMGLESGEFTNLDNNFKVTFSVVKDGSLTILGYDKVQVTITEHGAVKTYNNEEYVVTGYDFTTSNDLYTLSDFKFLGDSVVSGTNVGNYAMDLKAEDFENLNNNFEVEFNVVHNSLVINPLDVLVEITGNSLEVPYDKKEHEVSGYQWSANSDLYTVEDFEFGGDSALAETNVGVYPMGLESDEFTNLDNNFKVTFNVVEDGSLTILAPSKVQVTITEHGAVKTYNNEEYVVTGYDFATSNDLYTLSDFKFHGDSVVSGTNVGNYVMGLKTEDFENLNNNFEVEFNIVHNSLVINPLDVLVEITGNRLEVPYDKKEHEVSGYQWSANSDLYTVEDFEFGGDSALTETNVGVYPMGLESDEFTNLDGNFKVTFNVVEDGSLTILGYDKVQVTITEHGAVKTYNNEEYVVKGYDFASSNDLYTLSDFKFHGDSVVSGTNVGSYLMDLKPEDFENLNKNFEVEFNVVHNSLVINPLDVLVEITGNSLEVPYDKKEHEVSGYQWSANSDLYTVEDFEFGGDSALTETNVGVYPMGLESDEFTNLDNNFKVTFNVVKDGSLTILAPSKVQVTITEHGAEKTYNNEEYVVKGYDFASSNDLYTLSDFKFLGDSVVSGTNVGSYLMDLKLEDFENLNENFEVEFNVVHNSLVINPLDVLVEITGNRLEVPYDKKEHEVSGYQWSANSDLYTVEDFEFGGDSALTETNVGVYPMGLESDEFTNLDGNFKVTFNVVEDGSLTILGYDKVQVTITEHGAVKTYNNEEYVVKGYDFASSNDLYTLSDFKFHGDSVVSGTNVGSYLMDLKLEDFENLNKNFEVEFNIVHNSLVINPLDVLVEITGNSLEVPYDKKEHEVSGYQWSANSDLYTVEDFEFGGDSALTETNVGVYPMGLESDEFTNLDNNFKVTFNVVKDGSLTILGYDKVQVTITEHGAEKTYNNEEYVVKGYDFASSNDLYTLSDFKFLGDSVVSGTNVGSYLMDLKLEDFENLNKNFEVEFNIVHNSLVINPLDVLVEITGNSLEVPYDKKEHEVSGYQWSANSDLYTVEDFEFGGDSALAETNVGVYPMGLESGEFTNLDNNFKVTFNVVKDGSLTILGYDKVQVTITEHGAEKTYNNEEYVVTGYDFASSNDLYTLSDFKFLGDSVVSGTNVGSYLMDLKLEDFENLNKNFEVEFNIVHNSLVINPLDVLVEITGNSLEVPYDKKEHEVSGYQWSANSDLYTVEDFEFGGDSALAETNVGVYPMGLESGEFTNLDNNFKVTFNVVKDGSLTILGYDKVQVTITEHGAEKTYNNEEYVVKGYDFASSNDLYTLSDFKFLGDSVVSGTNVGSYLMDLKLEDFENLNKNFEVEFVITDNSLVIEPLNVIVEIVGNSAKEFYNKEEHEVSGYTWSSDSELYTVNDFEFSGDSVLTETNVGSYVMNLVETQFVNNNKNFNVTFSVTDGSLTIDKLSTIVTIVGNSVTKTFNGSEYMLSGYTWSADSEVYTEDDFMFNGDSIVVGTIVGSYPMDLNLNDFINLNDNIDVTFVVEDGELIVSELDIVVTIAGNTRTTNYNGISQSVLGYTWSANYDDYTESDFTFNGDSIAYGINVGTYPMNMTAEQFQNLNPNFGKVTFVIEDGNITIEPMIDEVLVQIYGYVEDVLYDGKEHTVSGYSVFSNNNLYGVGDFEFHGEELLKGVNAGVYQMGLSQDQFVNTNENFANVRFEVADGTLRINKRTVLLESESATRNYNGEVLSRPIVKELKDGFAEGEGATYEFYNDISFAGSVENDFSYTLNEGTLVDNYIIEQNNGLLSISPIREIIDIVANSAEKYHDGSVLVDSGYTYTENVLVDGDTLIVEIVGEITEVGTIANEIVSYKVMRGDVDVTDNYTFGSIKNGVLRVLYVERPVVVYAKNGKIAVHNANNYVYVHDMLSRLVYIHNSPTIYVTDYDEFEVPCTGTYLVRIGDESYKVVVQKK